MTESKMRDALESVRKVIVLAIAFLGRDEGTDRLKETLPQIIAQLAEADRTARAALSTTARGEAVAADRELLVLSLVNTYRERNGFSPITIELMRHAGSYGVTSMARDLIAIYTDPPAPAQAGAGVLWEALEELRGTWFKGADIDKDAVCQAALKVIVALNRAALLSAANPGAKED